MSANGRAGHSHARPGLVNANPMVDPHARKAMEMLKHAQAACGALSPFADADDEPSDGGAGMTLDALLDLHRERIV